MTTNLSDRVRAGSEAASWVIDAIKILEDDLAALKNENARLKIDTTDLNDEIEFLRDKLDGMI